MNHRVLKAQPRRSRVRLSKCLQEQLLNAIATTPSSPARPTKRQLDEGHQSPAKKARLTDVQQTEGEGGQPPGKPGQTPILQHPKPNPKPLYASFLEKFVDPSQPGPRADSEHSFVLEWLESVDSDRETRCRSESHLHPTDDSPAPRQFTRSAPAMGNTRDADGFAVPPTPASTRSYSRADAQSDITGSSSGPSGRSLVENPHYRHQNLAANNISLRLPNEEFPEQIASIVNDVRKDRDSPGPSLEDVRQDSDLAALQWMGAGEPQVEEYFRTSIFPSTRITESLQRSDRQPMAKHTVPSTSTRSSYKISTPVPDMLYGYSRQNGFPQQQAQLVSMGTEMVATNEHEGLLYPFFAIEFKGDGGSLWVATNQCLGGSASCVNIAENLNRRLRECKSDMVHPIDSAAFSIAMNGTEARLYISWKPNELEFYMANVDSFLLQDPEHYLKFRKYVRNIVDWGKGERLEGIRKSLDSLLEESRKRSSAAAKSRTPPSADPAGSCSYKTRRTSTGQTSKRRRGRSNSTHSSTYSSIQGQSNEAGEGEEYWEWDRTMGRWFHRNADGTLSWAEEGELDQE